MTDIHTHVLHGIDDGSSDLENSLKMLDVMSKQGVHTVVCTPHFDYRVIDPESFLKTRDEKIAELCEATRNRGIDIKILSGCELKLNNRMLTLDSTREFCIGNTKNILIELAVSSIWEETDFDRLINFCDYYNVRPVIAHVERYASVNKSLKYADKLIELGAILQLDGASLFEKLYQKTAKKLLKKGYISIVASDAHNLTTRPSSVLNDAYETVEKLCGTEAVATLKHNAELLLK
jgi:protein-tyrosine phosphatase